MPIWIEREIKEREMWWGEVGITDRERRGGRVHHGCVRGCAGVGGGGRWTGWVLGGEGDRIWRGGIAIEMEGDRDRVFS